MLCFHFYLKRKKISNKLFKIMNVMEIYSRRWLVHKLVETFKKKCLKAYKAGAHLWCVAFALTAPKIQLANGACIMCLLELEMATNKLRVLCVWGLGA